MLDITFTGNLDPFADEKAPFQFWRYVLTECQHLNDPTVTDELTRTFAAWRKRKEQETGAAKQQVLDAERAAKIVAAKTDQPTPPVTFTIA